MMEYRNVIVLQDARAVRDNLVLELAKRDFAVRSCGSLAGFRHLYASQPSPLVVLTGDSDDLACDAQSARMAAPGAIIIALGTAADTAWRMHVMAAGADACHAASIDIAELTAILLSWARQAARGFSVKSPDNIAARSSRRPFEHVGGVQRAGRARADMAAALSRSDAHPASSRQADPAASSHRSGSVDSGWRLDANCRALICPHDRTLFVTATENGFLMRIAASEGQLLRRRRIVLHGVAAQGGDQSVRDLDQRSMDVLVSRLRRKARDAGIELPLLAVRGCGYLFAEHLAVTSSFVASRSPAPNARMAQQVSLSPIPLSPLAPLAEPQVNLYAPRLLAA
jgi:DNA-binding response OmpR family regulator